MVPDTMTVKSKIQSSLCSTFCAKVFRRQLVKNVAGDARDHAEWLRAGQAGGLILTESHLNPTFLVRYIAILLNPFLRSVNNSDHN